MSSNPLIDGRLQDATCRIELVLGTGTMSLRECLTLTPGSIVRLAEPAGGYLQVVANGVPVARGEVVMLDASVSVRITDILPPSTNTAS